MTADAVMRHPSFEGMRIDKKASEVELETEKETAAVTRGRKNSSRKENHYPFYQE